MHGRGDSDIIYGGPGDDVLFGDILDDEIHGDDGDDILIGGHGTDILDGGAGNDFLRGDTGNDTFIGGDGYDIVELRDRAAARPARGEGRRDAEHHHGVKVAFDGNCDGGGCADGDGGNEPLLGIEGIVGSSFTDSIAGERPRRARRLRQRHDRRRHRVGTPTPVSTVFVDATTDRQGRLVDVGIVVLGSPARDDFKIHGNGDIVTVTADEPR